MLPYDNTDFFRVAEGKTVRIPGPSASKRIRNTVTLTPLKSLAMSPFAFPFSNVLRIREALKLQTLPYAAAGGMELFPSVLSKAPRSSSGFAWFVPAGELESVPAPLSQVENRVWPAPLPLVSRVGGEGATFWLDEENICSMLWRGGIPVLYRWKLRARTTVEAEQAWYEAYCKSKEEEMGAVFVLDAALPSELGLLPEIVRESLAAYPWIGDVNLSRSALDNALVMERAVASLSRVASWVLIMGLFVLAGNGLRYYSARQETEGYRARSENLFRTVFNPSRTGRIADPLGEARSINAAFLNKVEGRLINEVLTDLGDIFEYNPSMDVALDSIRYNLDGVDYTGSAPDMETAQEFRQAWSERADAAQLSNIAAAPGSGYRFDLSVKW